MKPVFAEYCHVSHWNIKTEYRFVADHFHLDINERSDRSHFLMHFAAYMVDEAVSIPEEPNVIVQTDNLTGPIFDSYENGPARRVPEATYPI